MNNQSRFWFTAFFVLLGSMASVFIAYGVYIHGIFAWDFYSRYIFDWEILRFGFLTLIVTYLLSHLLYVNKSFWKKQINSENLWFDSGLYSFIACQLILLLTYPWDTIDRRGEFRLGVLYFLLTVIVLIGVYNFVKQIHQEKNKPRQF